jgi:UDP-N-acetylglucosamine 2-epimerase (non-hydrolysing)
MKSVCFVLGTRPEIIKLAPLIRRARGRGIPFTIIHTGQHYDDALDGVFFRELSLPAPDANLRAAAPSREEMFDAMLSRMERMWTDCRPSVVVVQGDTNSALCGALLAEHMDIPVAHVEAGLRSGDLSMPEEVNRIRMDKGAARLYVPTPEQAEIVRREGIPTDRILVTGNTIADAVNDHKDMARDAELRPPLDELARGRFAIVTLHRPALVDDPAKLADHLRIIDGVFSAEGITGAFLCHPRTRAKLAGQDLSFSSLIVAEPIGYFPMLRLLGSASILVTDSGGLQEEAALLRVPCVTVRENTERPETLRAGGNALVGFDPGKLEAAVKRFLHEPIDWKPLYDVAAPSDAILDDLVARFL